MNGRVQSGGELAKINLASHAAYEAEVGESLQWIRRLFEAGENFYFQTTATGQLAMEHLFFQFYLKNVRETGKNQFLAIATEENPILKSLEQMEMMGCGVKLLPVDGSGRMDLEALKKAIGPKTAFLSLSAVCAMTGVMQPVTEIIEICRTQDVKVHVNATHAMGSWGVSLKEWDVDYLTFDGQTAGGLFSQEPLMGDLGVIDFLAEEIKEMTTNQEQFAMEAARLRSTFEGELVRAIPDCTLIGQDVERVPHIFAASFPGIMNEALMYTLHRQNMDVSIGGGRFQSLREILHKCGSSDETALGAISLSLPRHHLQEEDLAEALSKIVSAVRKLKKMSVALG